MPVTGSHGLGEAVVIDDRTRSRGTDRSDRNKRLGLVKEWRVPGPLALRPESEDHLLASRAQVQLGVKSRHRR
jgi:hypothetical protein